ncbi:MAG TPA: hypothetical protein VH107_16290 [Lacipirellulaceae bacterium]|jgi:hypothetical protein|nr:hypothetical protein [Lacipirellulaceae bacterium]
MRSRYLLIALSLVVALSATRRAAAIKPFYDEFKKDYIENNENKGFAEEAGKPPVGCLICHQGLKNKKTRNPFGKEVGKLLDKKKDAKDTAKMDEAFKKALAMHVDPKDDKSETYMDRIKAGKFPGGTLEELKKEPPKAAETK